MVKPELNYSALKAILIDPLKTWNCVIDRLEVAVEKEFPKGNNPTKPKPWGFMTVSGRVLHRVWMPLDPLHIRSYLIIELPCIK